MAYHLSHLLSALRLKSVKIKLIYLITALSITSLSPQVSEAQGDEVQRAVELDRRAKQLIAEGKHYEAAELYRKALRLFEHPDLFLNLAQAELELREYQSAYSACTKALQSPLLTPGKRREASQCVAEAQKKMNEIHAVINTYPPKAQVRIDGQSVGETPWSGQLAPGRRQFDFSLEGFERATRSLNAVPGAQVKLTVRLIPEGMGGVVTFRTTPPGASVMIDNEFIGKSPITSFPISKGSHSLQIVLNGHLPENQQIYIGEGGNEEFSFYLKPLRGRVSATDLWPAWGLISTGILTGALGGYFGYRALDARDNARTLALQDGTALGYQEYRLQVRDMENAAQTADILWVTSGVMLTSGTLWWLIAR